MLAPDTTDQPFFLLAAIALNQIGIDMGFFKVHRGLYQLNIPKTVKVETVRSAAIELLGTEDRHYHLHPEILVEIKAHQKNAADKRQVGGCYF
jgi:hypothetical protein